MQNKFLWKKARVIDSSLQGENWPEKLTLAQIAKLLFPDSDDKRKLLLSFMNEQVEDGGLEFNDIRVSPKWHSSNVSLSIVGDNALYASIREDSRKSREMDLLKMHEPVFGWVEGLKGTELNNPIKLEQHLCGCNSECTIEKSYRNGLPKRWRVEGVHDDGLKISFSCTSEPLISANQCRDFLGSVNQHIPVDSTLNGWGGDLKLQFQVGGNEIEDQAATEPVSAKVIQPNNNEFALSGLLHKPNGEDDWFEVIDVMTKAFYLEHGVRPTKAQAWTQLCTNPPTGYGIKPDDGNKELTMTGFIKALNKRSFDRRWAKYTAKSNPFKPN